jgi:hypothetical protein
MSNFYSLTLACEGWFDKPLYDLPDGLRQRLEDDFWPMPWDRLSAARRRDVTRQWDYENDPATEQERQYAWDLSDQMLAIEAQIAMWESIAAPTAGDLALKEVRLAELRQELAQMEDEVFVDGGATESPRNPAKPTKKTMGSVNLQAPVDNTATGKSRGSTVRRDARRLDTEEFHKRLQKAYREAKKAHPDMTDSWYSKYIAKMPIAKKRSSETIRRNMKS